MSVTVRRVSGNDDIEHIVSTRKVYQTRNYELFAFDPTNRPVTKRNVAQKIKSLEQHGFLEDFPIHVVRGDDGKLVIGDGQHRFAAAKELGLPVYYIFKENSDVTTDIRVAHAYSIGWTGNDFVRHFAAQGNENYKKVQDFSTRYHVPISIAAGMLATAHASGMTAVDRGHGFKIGTFTVDPKIEAKAHDIMQKVEEIRAIHPRIRALDRSRAFLAALVAMIRSKHYDHARFLEKANEQVLAFVTCSNVPAYLDIFTKIFNFRCHSDKRFEFTRTGSYRLRKRRASEDT